MTRGPLLAIPLAFALWPAAGADAQQGPSFNCGYASTRTEIAICNSPELSGLERRMVESYERLAAAIGRSDARQIADEHLARRQACEGDAGCIAERLLISTEVFEQRAGRDRVAESVPSVPLPDRDGDIATFVPPEPAPEPAPQVAAAPPAADGDIPLAAQAPWPPESTPVPPSRGTDTELASAADLPMAGLPDPEELSRALDGAELASSDGAGTAEASFDTPLSWAFMDLEREDRARIQERLAQAGFLQGEASGAWTTATQASLERFAEEEGSGSFDLSTQSGGALLLDYIGSEAFATAFDLEPAAAAPAEEADPLAGADW